MVAGTPAPPAAGASGAWSDRAILTTENHSGDLGKTGGSEGDARATSSDPGPLTGLTTPDPVASSTPTAVAGQGPARDLGPLAGTPLAAQNAGTGMPPATSLIPALFGYEQLHTLLGTGTGGQPLGVNDLVRAPLDGELARATAISDVRQVVAEGVGLAGGGALDSGATPPTPTVPMPPPVPAPEPSTWVLFAVASLPLLRRARRAGLARRDAAR